MTINITPITPEPSWSTNYRYYNYTPDNSKWKAKVTFLDGRPPTVNTEATLAPSEYAVSVSVSPINSSGQALLDNFGRPIVMDSMTHTFDNYELNSQEFDPVNTILEKISECIESNSRKLQAIIALNQLKQEW